MEFEKLQKIVADVMDMDAALVTREKSFADDLSASSLDRMEIIMQLEDELGIEIPDEVLDQIVTVGDAYDAIQKVQ